MLCDSGCAFMACDPGHGLQIKAEQSLVPSLSLTEICRLSGELLNCVISQFSHLENENNHALEDQRVFFIYSCTSYAKNKTKQTNEQKTLELCVDEWINFDKN